MHKLILVFYISHFTQTRATQCLTNIEGKVCGWWQWRFGGWLRYIDGMQGDGHRRHGDKRCVNKCSKFSVWCQSIKIILEHSSSCQRDLSKLVSWLNHTCFIIPCACHFISHSSFCQWFVFLSEVCYYSVSNYCRSEILTLTPSICFDLNFH